MSIVRTTDPIRKSPSRGVLARLTAQLEAEDPELLVAEIARLRGVIAEQAQTIRRHEAITDVYAFVPIRVAAEWAARGGRDLGAA